MRRVAENLQAVRARIAQAAVAAGRAPETVALLAVSKQQPAERIREARTAGQRAFGENYVQEALAKMDALGDLDLEWHLVGPLQSNKTRLAAERFDWVQTVASERIAERLAAQRPAARGPLEVLVQVNVSGEASKSGVAPQAAAALARAVAQLPNLRLRGLMAIPEPGDPARRRAQFRRLRELFAALVREGLALDTLSMGMSEDMELAIAEGATMVRVGTAIFGPRPAAARRPSAPQPSAETSGAP
ncbi:MAG: YggS family pyridoxal phosphate-dependent enzyme [Burkholderiales bacterium]|nr:YggS family pyridoxal phosphate-dependent enzyme [Burkholderiales bacterium]